MGSEQDCILLERDGPIARVTLNRPEKRNALSLEMCRQLFRLLDEIRYDDELRVVRLGAAGDIFCAGGDLSMLGAGVGDEPHGLGACLLAMHELGKPIVVAVKGHALAGGLGLCIAGDIVIASEAAQFGTTEIKVGLWPMMITAELVRNIGRKAALELILTGELVSAARARELGMVNRVVPPDRLDAEADELCAKFAQNSATVVGLGLRAFYRSQDMEHSAALRYLKGELARVLATEDAQKRMAEFLASRKKKQKQKKKS